MFSYSFCLSRSSAISLLKTCRVCVGWVIVVLSIGTSFRGFASIAWTEWQIGTADAGRLPGGQGRPADESFARGDRSEAIAGETSRTSHALRVNQLSFK